MRSLPRAALLAAALVIASMPADSAGASYQWDFNGATAGLGGGGTANPVSATAWDLIGDGLDTGTDTTVASNNAPDSYYFGGLSGTGTAGTINNNGGYGFAGFVYFTLAGYTLQDTSANGDITFAKMVTVGGTGTTTFAATSSGWGDFKFNGGLTVNSGATAKIGVRANAANAISSVASLTGAGNVTFYGSNIHRLSGANTTFTGTARLESATLQLMNLNSLAGGTLEYVGGALSFNGGVGTYNLGGLTGSSSITLNGNSLSIGAKNADTTFSGAILLGTGGGGVTKVGTGALTLSNAGSTYNGGTTLSDGTLNFVSGALGTTGNVTLNGGKLQWATGNTQDLSSRFVMVNGKGAQLDTNGNDVTLASGFGGATTGSLTKLGSGVLTISGAANYTGATTISAGRLNLTGSLASNIALDAGSITGSGSTTGSLTTAGGTTFLLAGGATTTGLTANGVTFGASTALDFAVTPNLGTTYDVVTYGAGGLTGLANLTVLIRGTMADTGTKLTFATPGAFVTRTWTAGSGTWSINGAANFAEDDQKFFNTDNVVFGNIAADATVTLSGLLRPTSVTASNSSGTYTLSGTSGSAEITGSASLTKSGAGTLVLASAQSYSGGTTVNGGTLQIGAGGAGAGIATNGSYVVNAGGALRVYQGSGAIVAPAWASITGAGILALNKDGTGSTNKDWGTASLGAGFTGTLWIEEGRVSTASGASLGGATEVVIEAGAQLGTWDGGTFSPNLTIAGTGWGETNYEVAIRGGNGAATSIFSGNIALAASAALGAAAGGFLQVDGAVTGAAGAVLTVGTSGALTGGVRLNGSNTYAGNTVIAAGSLRIGSGGKLGAGSYAGNISIGNGTAFYYSSSSAQTLSGSISGAGALTKDTSSSGKLTLSGSNSYTGQTTVSAGELAITGSSSGASRFLVQGAAADSPVLTIASGAGAINTNGSIAFVVAGAANTTGTVNMAGGTLTANYELWLGDGVSTANGKFYLTGGTVEVKNWTAVGRSGVGLLEISGGLWKNTTTGNFAVGTGTGGNNSGVVNVKGTGTLEVIGRTLAIRESTGVNSQGTLNLSETGVVKATTVSFGLNSAAVAGTGNLNISGGNLWANSIIRSGSNTTANISLSGGTLGALDASATWSVAMVLAAGTTTTFAASDFAGNARYVTVSGALSGSGALSKSGNGILILNTSNSHTGGTTVTAGGIQAGHSGALNGQVTLSGGELFIGNGIALNVDRGLTFASNTGASVVAMSGQASIYGFDVNTADIVVNTGINGSIASSVGVGTGVYGVRFDVNGTGTLSVAGALSGTGNVGGDGLAANDRIALFKFGSGDLTLTGASTFTAGSSVAATALKEGRLLLSDGDNRLPTGSAMYLGSSANTSGRLVLVGVSQSLAGLATVGTGDSNAVVGGSAVLSTLTVNNAGDYTFAGALGGAGANENNLALIKSGAGLLTLSGANTYAGGTTVSAGTLVIGDVAALGSGEVLVAGGVLDLNSLNPGNVIRFTGGALANTSAWASGEVSLVGAVDAASINALAVPVVAIRSGASVSLDGVTRAITLDGGTITAFGNYSGQLTLLTSLDLDGQGSTPLTTSAAIEVGSGATLSGVGAVGQISGAGTVAPGNSPGIITATSIDPSAGTDFNFEFTATDPDWLNDSNSLNDVIRLTGATPFAAALGAANEVNLFLSYYASSAPELGDALIGGFSTDSQFFSFIQNATFNFYTPDAAGSVAYNGANYSLYSGTAQFSIDTVYVANIDFFDNSGYAMRILVVPEPSTYGMALGGLALALAALRRRRR